MPSCANHKYEQHDSWFPAPKILLSSSTFGVVLSSPPIYYHWTCMDDTAYYTASIILRNHSSLAALTVLVLEWLSAFPHEVERIWRRPITIAKSIYIFARYLGLTSQIANFIALTNYLSMFPIPGDVCRIWFICLFFVFVSLLLAVDILIMLRVYALYNKSTKIASIFGLFLATQLAIGMTCYVNSIRFAHFDPICNLTTMPPETYYYASMESIIQLTIWMMLSKRRISLIARNVGRIPLVELLFRDGTFVAIVICAILLGNLPYSLHTERTRSHVLFTWPITFFSSVACRLIMNMYSSGVQPNPTAAEIYLTSLFGVTTEHSTHISQAYNDSE